MAHSRISRRVLTGEVLTEYPPRTRLPGRRSPSTIAVGPGEGRGWNEGQPPPTRGFPAPAPPRTRSSGRPNGQFRPVWQTGVPFGVARSVSISRGGKTTSRADRDPCRWLLPRAPRCTVRGRVSKAAGGHRWAGGGVSSAAQGVEPRAQLPRRPVRGPSCPQSGVQSRSRSLSVSFLACVCCLPQAGAGDRRSAHRGAGRCGRDYQAPLLRVPSLRSRRRETSPLLVLIPADGSGRAGTRFSRVAEISAMAGVQAVTSANASQSTRSGFVHASSGAAISLLRPPSEAVHAVA